MINVLSVQEICRKNNLIISDHQMYLLDRYVLLLSDWNKKINLISRKDISNIWIRHIIGSLAILFQNTLKVNCTIADIGTGGGLPGIPLAIMLPQSQVALIDSIRKKIYAVENIVGELALTNIRPISARVEELSKTPNYRHSFDYVTARAVAPLRKIVEWSGRLLKKSNKSDSTYGEAVSKNFIHPGSIIIIKGGEIDDEITHAKISLPNWMFNPHPIVVDGISPDDLYDKKLVIVTEGNKK